LVGVGGEQFVMNGVTRTQASSKLARRFCVGLAVFLVLALPAAALAQTTLGTATTNIGGSFDTTVTIPATTTPGTYDIAATGDAPALIPYPPSSAPAISVDRTVVRAGESVRVFGSGFSSNTTITLRLEFVSSFTIAQLFPTQTVTARARIFVVGPGATIPPPIFRDIIRGVPVPVPVAVPVFAGQADRGGPIVVNNNNSSSSSSSAAASAGGGGGVVAVPTPQAVPTPRTLARTGIETLPLLAASLASILLGAVCLSADRRRYLAQSSPVR
jgi:hypothetical protein